MPLSIFQWHLFTTPEHLERRATGAYCRAGMFSRLCEHEHFYKGGMPGVFIVRHQLLYC